MRKTNKEFGDFVAGDGFLQFHMQSLVLYYLTPLYAAVTSKKGTCGPLVQVEGFLNTINELGTLVKRRTSDLGDKRLFCDFRRMCLFYHRGNSKQDEFLERLLRNAKQ